MVKIFGHFQTNIKGEKIAGLVEIGLVLGNLIAEEAEEMCVPRTLSHSQDCFELTYSKFIELFRLNDETAQDRTNIIICSICRKKVKHTFIKYYALSDISDSLLPTSINAIFWPADKFPPFFFGPSLIVALQVTVTICMK